MDVENRSRKEEAPWRPKVKNKRRRLHGGRRGKRREEAQWRRLEKGMWRLYGG